MNIAARAGRRSSRHPRLALVGWLVFAVLAFMTWNNVGTDVLTDDEAAVAASGWGARITAEAYPATIDESSSSRARRSTPMRPSSARRSPTCSDD
jgi:hypothetical protein